MPVTLDLIYDELKRKIPTGWWLEFDGEDHFFPESLCEIDEDNNTITAPQWLMEKERLEGYAA